MQQTVYTEQIFSKISSIVKIYFNDERNYIYEKESTGKVIPDQRS
jgi:hypothetical protein